MPRKRIVPSHFRADGKPKTAYESESIARAEAERLGMTYYRCDFCNRFHLASKQALGAIVGILAVFAAFLFVGPITGIVVRLAVVVLAGVLLVRLIRANEM